MLLNVNKLSVKYRARKFVEALKGVSFNVEEGEILGIVGESGSGKSTLAYSILNLLPQETEIRGEIFFEGKNIFSLSPKELKILRGKTIAMIPQEPSASFNPVLSIGYQFQEFLREAGIKDKDKISYIIKDSFKRVMLEPGERIINSYPHQLSGGQIQRVMIAMAISVKPKLLIADEPTSSLDVTIESQIVNLILQLRKELDLSIIFITHNLGLIKVLADRVVVLYRGEVKEVNSKDYLFTSPKDDYTKLLLSVYHEMDS
ncbi:MAG: ABC transporter ATP-binding protein [Candidatus Omnitrophica bacterium]|nr:ABC transporter ATP-binding protein [Candidatus Omnitrophota bacterium]MCM8826090.1 ABC transporter ATP-binding protein [Candidatus Omnitrophota bacterium]